jgi:hypothetical protein
MKNSNMIEFISLNGGDARDCFSYKAGQAPDDCVTMNPIIDQNDTHIFLTALRDLKTPNTQKDYQLTIVIIVLLY